MQEEQQKKVLDAFQLVLRPIVKILLRYGIGYNAFAETVKTAFVDVGSTEFGIRGRPTNISRVAVMTGLTRKEVRRLRTKIEGGDDRVSVRTTPITEIISRWHSENEYLDRNGRPIPLPFTDDSTSFSSLVKDFGGDVPPGAMRTELKRMGLVVENESGELVVQSRAMVPADSTDNLMSCLIHGVYPLLATTARNTEPDLVRGEGTAQFTAYSLSIGQEDRARLRRISYERLSEMAVSFDDLFTTFESSNGNASSSSANDVVSVGLYYFEETDTNARYKW
jgi:hypothetical protein